MVWSSWRRPAITIRRTYLPGGLPGRPIGGGQHRPGCRWTLSTAAPYLDFSEYGDAANIAAPGVNVLSTWYDGNYAEESGTSMAAPHVSAAAALVMAADPSLSGPQVATLYARRGPPGVGSAPIDGGLLDVGAAVKAAATRALPATLDGYQLVGSQTGACTAPAWPWPGVDGRATPGAAGRRCG